MAMVEAGQPAPAFTAPDQDGNTVSNDTLRGQWVVLYFYPRDDTPGCTKEACNFRDNHTALEAAGAKVIGVSGDNAASHEKFRQKYDLPFPLLSDTGHSVGKAFGAWGLKQNYGKTYEGMIRSTFVIDPQGNVAKVWPRVKPDTHAGDVLDWLKANATGAG